MAVSRREFIVGAAGAGVASGVEAAFARRPVTPEMFGATGNGVTNDHGALLLFAQALSNSKNVSAQMGKGKTYFIGQHATASNGVVSLRIHNAVGLRLNGNGASLSFDGSFDRTASETAGIGLQFTSCRQSKILNLKLNGNVQHTTNSSRSTESFQSYGLNVIGCIDCQFDNIETHHFATDGFAVGALSGSPCIGSKRITVSDLNSHHNGRSNISVFLAERVTFKNCRSSYAGITDGSYPGHSPLCGLDIEPDQALVHGTGDINTNRIRFEECKFLRNKSSDINGTLDSISEVSFTGCHVESEDSPGSPSSIIIGFPGVVFRDCHLNLGTRRLELSAGGTGKATHLFENCDILGSAVRSCTIYSAFPTKMTVFKRCRLRCTATRPKANLFLAVNNPNFVIEDCDLFIPSAYFVNEGGGGCKVSDVIMRRAARNRYATDLSTPGKYFYTKWNTTDVIEETYRGIIPGTHDTFRPSLSSTFNTTKKYSKRGFASGFP